MFNRGVFGNLHLDVQKDLNSSGQDKEDISNDKEQIQGVYGLNGELKTLVIPATSSLTVSHGLGRKPIHRLILAQTSGGPILDREFTNTDVTFYNSGSSEANVIILILKAFDHTSAKDKEKANYLETFR